MRSKIKNLSGTHLGIAFFSIVACLLMTPSWAAAQSQGLAADGINKRGQTSGQEGTGISADGTMEVTLIANGREIRVDDNDRDIKIYEYKNGTIQVEVSRVYRPSELEQLAAKYPELGAHLSAIPGEVGGEKIEIKIRTTKEGYGKNQVDLQKKHPGLFNIYKRFSSKADTVELYAGDDQGNRGNVAPGTYVPSRSFARRQRKLYDAPGQPSSVGNLRNDAGNSGMNAPRRGTTKADDRRRSEDW